MKANHTRRAGMRGGSGGNNPAFRVVEGSRMPKSAITKSRPAASRHSDAGTGDWRDTVETVRRDETEDLLIWE